MKICLHQQNYICASSQIDFVQASTGNAVILVPRVEVQTSNRRPGGFCWRNASVFGPEIYTGVRAILDFKQFVVRCSFYVWRPEWNEMKGKMTVWIKIFFFFLQRNVIQQGYFVWPPEWSLVWTNWWGNASCTHISKKTVAAWKMKTLIYEHEGLEVNILLSLVIL